MVGTTNLVGYWKFDDTGTTLDDAHGSYDGTISGGTTETTGKINDSVSHDGSNDCSYVPHAAALEPDAVTVTMWVKVNTSTVQGNISLCEKGYGGNDSGWYLTYDEATSSRGYWVGFRNNSGTQSYKFTAVTTKGEWIFIAIRFAGTAKISLGIGSTLTHYSGGSVGGTLQKEGYPVTFGARTTYNTSTTFENFAEVDIDEAALFNTDLSDSDIADIFNSGDGLAYPFSSTTTYTKSIGSDSKIFATDKKELVSSSYVQKDGYEDSITMDSVIAVIDTRTKNITSGSVILEAGDWSDTWEVDVTASAETTYSVNILSNSNIFDVYDKNIESDSTVLDTNFANIVSDSYILKVTDKSIESDSYVFDIYEANIVSNTFIFKEGYEDSISSSSHIEKADNEKNLLSSSYLLESKSVNIGSDSTLTGSISANILSNSFIKKLATATNIESDSYVKKLATEKNLLSNAEILDTSSNNLLSTSYIKKLATEKNLTSDLVIFVDSTTETENIGSDSYILTGIEQVVHVSPLCGGASEADVEFVWRIPIDTIGSDVHSILEIDTVDTFDSVNLTVLRTYVDSDFEYWNGSGWVAYPVTGVTNTYYHNNARRVVYLSGDTYYWRVRGLVTED